MRLTAFRPAAAMAAALLLAATALVGSSPAEAKQPGRSARVAWAPASSAAIHPGVQMFTRGAQCTANFVFTDAAKRIYVGYAAHCAGQGSSEDINGCATPSHPLGTRVVFGEGAGLLTAGRTVGRGRLAYSSWISMQQRKVTNRSRCLYNDFALVRVDKAHSGKVNPSVPGFGGPTGLGGARLDSGDRLYTVGASSLRLGGGESKKQATIIGRVGGGLGYDIRSGNPGIPGDSGSGFLDSQGRARAVLSTISVGLSLTPVTNTVGDLAAEVAWAQRYSGIKGLRLARGTVRFSGR